MFEFGKYFKLFKKVKIFETCLALRRQQWQLGLGQKRGPVFRAARRAGP